MANFKLAMRLASLSQLLVLSLLMLPVWVTPAIAQHRSGSNSMPHNPFNPPDEGAPRRTASGGSRGGCPGDRTAQSEEHPLVLALLAPSDQAGRTLSGHPTFLAYVSQTTAQAIYFSLQDEQGNLHHQATFSLSKTPGIVAMQLPQTASPLQPGKTYLWSFALVCGDRLEVNSPVAQSWIQRVTLNSSEVSQLLRMRPLEQLAFYHQMGIWFDTLGTLAELRRSHPENLVLSAQWLELLEVVGLETVATEPFVNWQ